MLTTDPPAHLLYIQATTENLYIFLQDMQSLTMQYYVPVRMISCRIDSQRTYHRASALKKSNIPFCTGDDVESI